MNGNCRLIMLYARSVGFSLGGGSWEGRLAVVCLLVCEVVFYSFTNLVFANTRPCTRFQMLLFFSIVMPSYFLSLLCTQKSVHPQAISFEFLAFVYVPLSIQYANYNTQIPAIAIKGFVYAVVINILCFSQG